MKKTLCLLILALGVITLRAQDYQIPKNYELNKAEDYAKYEQDVIKTYDWLMETPVSSQPEKRKEACAFLVKWISGCPNITVDIKPEIVTFIETNPEQLIIFMGGWCKKALETKDYTNKEQGNFAGIEGVIAYYTKNKDLLKKDKDVEKYIKMKEKGTLKDYVKKKFK